MKIRESALIIDTNALITPFNQYYAPVFTATYWNQLGESIEKGTLVIIQQVADEIRRGYQDRKKHPPDQLLDWNDLYAHLHVDTDDIEDFPAAFGAVLDHISQCGFYSDIAIERWSDKNVADPRLIAAAMSCGGTVVTLEGRHGKNLRTSNPLDEAKIPDVCTHFGVPCVNVFDMMRRLPIVTDEALVHTKRKS